MPCEGRDEVTVYLQSTGTTSGGTNTVTITVPVGAKVRLGVTLLAVEDIPGGSQQTYQFVFECEGASKPSCVAEVIFRSYE